MVRDLRYLIERLDDEGLLVRVKVEVDWREEIGAIVRRVNDVYRKNIPAILFEKIKGYSEGYRLFTNGFTGTRCQAVALGLSKNTRALQLVQEFRRRVQNKVKPKVVSDGPCKENILKGDDVDLLKFPVPLWHIHDGGRYIGTWHGVHTKDRDSEWVNVGCYRLMVHDRRRLGILLHPRHHISWHYRKYEEMDKPMPVAISIGHEEEVSICAATPFQPYEYEIEYAGALRGEPIELVRCETNDLYVPANSEIVIEGEMPPKGRLEEGPFGEWTGYYGGERAPRAFIEVKCITFRSNPILRGSLEGPPVVENHGLWGVTLSALAWNVLERAGIPGIKGVYCLPDTGATVFAIAIEQMYPQHARDVGKVLLSTEPGQFCKIAFVTNDDIDITDAATVLWAAHWRSQPDRDWVILKNEADSVLDPSVPLTWRGFTSKVIVDCAWKMTPEFPPLEQWGGKRYPPLAVPSDDALRLVERRWKEYGIDFKPEIESGDAE